MFQECWLPWIPYHKCHPKTLSSERCLKRKSEKTQVVDCLTPSIRVVSTFGSDIDIVSSVKKFTSSLSRTRSFSESDISDPALLVPEPHTSTPSHRLSVPNLSTRSSRSLSPSLSISRIASPGTHTSNYNAPSHGRSLSNSSAPVQNKLFQFVKKTGASIIKIG